MSNSTGPDFVPGICTQCGAPIEVDPSIEAAVCPFCGTPYVTTKAIEKYYIVNNVRNSNDVYNIQQGKKGVAQSVFEYMDKRAAAKETANAEARAAAERMRIKELEAQEEARRQTLEAEMQERVLAAEAEERVRAQKEKAAIRRALVLHQIGLILLWSFFFPVMLVYTVLRRKRETKENSERLLHGYSPKEVSEVPIGILTIGAVLFFLFTILLFRGLLKSNETATEQKLVVTSTPAVTATVPPTPESNEQPLAEKKWYEQDIVEIRSAEFNTETKQLTYGNFRLSIPQSWEIDGKNIYPVKGKYSFFNVEHFEFEFGEEDFDNVDAKSLYEGMELLMKSTLDGMMGNEEIKITGLEKRVGVLNGRKIALLNTDIEAVSSEGTVSILTCYIPSKNQLLMVSAARIQGEDAISDDDVCAVLNSVSFVDSK